MKNSKMLAMILLCSVNCSTALFAQSKSQPLEFVKSIVLSDVPEGPYSDYMTIDPASERLFATPQAANAVAVIDVKTDKLIKLIRGFGNPHGVYFSPVANRLFVADSVDGDVKVFDGTTFEKQTSIPLAKGADWLLYDPGTKLIYVNNGGKEAGRTTSVVSIIDPLTARQVGEMSADSPALQASITDPKSGILYLNLVAKKTVAVYDLRTRREIALWHIGEDHRNMSITLDADAHRLYLGCRDSDVRGSIVVLDTKTGEKIATLPIGGWVDSIYFDKTRRRIYASTGIGTFETYQELADGTYERLPGTDTSVMAKTSLYAPSTDRVYVSAPHLGSLPYRILEFKPVP